MPKAKRKTKRVAVDPPPPTRSRRQGGGDRDDEEVEIVRLGAGANNTNQGTPTPFQQLFAYDKTRTTEEFALSVESVKTAEDSLVLHVPNETWEKIWQGQFIELSTLLPKSAVPQKTDGNVYVSETGQFSVRSKPARPIQNIREWTDAFMVYMAIYIKKFPNQAGAMLEYMSVIREVESYSKGSMTWRSYDEGFRLRRSLDKKPWDSINYTLWLRTMTFPTLPTAVETPFKPNQAGAFPQRGFPQQMQSTPMATQNTSKGTCYRFNSLDGCPYPVCKFSHICLACRGSHSVTACPRTLGTQNFRRGGSNVGQRKPKPGFN